ncbi:MAG: xanthine dehydrogenase molybdopterin binding subunit [Betaproteobacteria bacterium]|nr:xanthine dehydrogenase molybdopterin binding subunit [Betaproteobacteria bacterium]
MSTIATHESAHLHVQGHASYIDDLPLTEGTLHAAPILSNAASGRILSLDLSAVLASPGVQAVITADDIPGDKLLATFVHDEPVFASERVDHIGQVLGLVLANSHTQARAAAHRAILKVQTEPPLLDARQSQLQQATVMPHVHVSRGHSQAQMEAATHHLHGQLEIGGQEHYYLETQIAYAIPQDNGEWLIHSSTQHPGEVQHWVAHALDLPMHAVRVVCRRMGGGFGGKETQAGHLAVWAALAAKKTGRPVKMRLSREDDFLVTGKRHPFSHDFKAGFDDKGLLLALQSTQWAHCGFSADLSGPVADRAVFHTDNAYFLSDVDIVSHRSKLNTQSHTAFRGFGGPQGMMLIETVMGDMARRLQLDPLDVRLRNLYGQAPRNTTPYGMTVEDNILPELMTQLANDCNYRQRRTEIVQWNASHAVIKKGLALTPVKFGISFTATQFNQAGALVSVFTDGSVRINHGGTEMGQGLHTKVCAIVADVLGIPNAQVRISSSDTDKIANASATAASSGTDLNGRAAERAALQVKQNISLCIAKADDCQPEEVVFQQGLVHTPFKPRTFVEAVQFAYSQRVQLWSDGFYATPKIHYDRHTLTGRPFFYFAYGAACSEVAIDTLTGEHKLLRVDILHDVGKSLNPAIDIGQIEGGFVQGLGWLTTEELVWASDGKLLTRGASTYKIPTAADIPEHFNIKLWHEANREDTIGGSKAVGEPPFMLAMSVYEALRDAVGQTLGGHTPIQLNTPVTPERVLMALQTPASTTT